MSDGSVYKGNFEHNKMDGKGRLMDSSGTVFEGFWHKGKREGKIKEKSIDGIETEGVWYYGKLMYYSAKEGDFFDKKKTKEKQKKEIIQFASI